MVLWPQELWWPRRAGAFPATFSSVRGAAVSKLVRAVEWAPRAGGVPPFAPGSPRRRRASPGPAPGPPAPTPPVSPHPNTPLPHRPSPPTLVRLSPPQPTSPRLTLRPPPPPWPVSPPTLAGLFSPGCLLPTPAPGPPPPPHPHPHPTAPSLTPPTPSTPPARRPPPLCALPVRSALEGGPWRGGGTQRLRVREGPGRSPPLPRAAQGPTSCRSTRGGRTASHPRK
ncbi:uncharacterized protein LOC135233038 [Loxodonta africana]|uniref:uncharacterized protein LOC135233038 n=1 Tax=Loxodonta africana TaxID=9785 RepID=UPI0030CB439E